MKKYLGISTILATSVILTACTNDNVTPNKTTENTTITSSTNSSSASTTTSNNPSTSAPTSEVTTQSQAASSQDSTTTTSPASSSAVASKINVGAIAGGNLASVLGSYTALNGGTYTIKDSKTIVYNADGQEKVLTITGYGQLDGAAVVNAVFSSIDGKPVDANTPTTGDLGAAFYFVPAGQAAPAGFFAGDTNKDRVVTLNNAFYLN